jgi:hypothetical protein
LEQLAVPDAALETLYQLVNAHPGILLSTLRVAAPDIPADLINIAMSRRDLYVDLATYRLSEPWRTPVFCNRQVARAYGNPLTKGDERVVHSTITERASSITPEGRALLEQARECDLSTAVFRNRVINPDQYGDDEQVQINTRANAIPVRTKRRWRNAYQDAESRYGSGFSACYHSLPILGENGRLAQRLKNSSIRFLRLITIPWLANRNAVPMVNISTR